jgi:biopolymer transport protein ExbB
MFHHILLQVAPAVNDTLHHAAAAAAPLAATTPPVVTTPWQLIMGSAWIMFPLFFFFLLAIYFSIERLFVISKAGKVDSNFMHNIKDYLLNGKVDSARELCRVQNTPVSRVIEKGISRLGKPEREISEAMESVGRQEMARVERNLHFLTLVSRIAPMLGFIGTIAGVITIFYDINHSGDISITTISGGLYQKMFSSGTGLFVGVFAFLFYHILNVMADNVAGKIERASMEFLDIINQPGK